MNFDSLGALARHFDDVANRLPRAINRELETQGAAIEAKAKAKFGTYQEGWPSLAESTKQERVRQGYTPDDPLFRSGELQSLVTHAVDEGGLFVGVEPGTSLAGGADAALVMGVHEYGSTDGRVPARPVFGVVVNEVDGNVAAFGLGAAIGAGLQVDG